MTKRSADLLSKNKEINSDVYILIDVVEYKDDLVHDVYFEGGKTYEKPVDVY